MTQEQAVRIAIEAIREQLKKIAVDANLYSIYHLETPVTISAYARRVKLREAVQVLQSFQGRLI